MANRYLKRYSASLTKVQISPRGVKIKTIVIKKTPKHHTSLDGYYFLKKISFGKEVEIKDFCILLIKL